MVRAGDVSVKVSGVISQQAAADKLPLLPDAEQTGLRLLELIGIRVKGFNPVKAIPESLRGEPFRREAPKRVEDTVAVPLGDLGLWAGLADAMDGREQEIVGGRRAGAGRWPESG